MSVYINSAQQRRVDNITGPAPNPKEMSGKHILVAPDGTRFIFRPHKKDGKLFMINNKPFSIEEARATWLEMRSKGYYIWRAKSPEEIEEERFDQWLEDVSSMPSNDPVGKGYDGLGEEYWSGAGENADPGDHW